MAKDEIVIHEIDESQIGPELVILHHPRQLPVEDNSASERRRGEGRRSGEDRRGSGSGHGGPERRRGEDRRSSRNRRQFSLGPPE